MSNSIGSTFASGVQDVAAILPLLGTEQCEIHITSGLKHGFLYPAATTLSVFGSLGSAKAGLKVLLASIHVNSLGFLGAKILKNAGFGSANEEVLDAMLLDEAGTRYGAENQLDAMLKLTRERIYFDNVRDFSVHALESTAIWNMRMVVFTAIFSMLGIIPYIHLNLRGNSPHSALVKWFFPSARVLGSFLVAVSAQYIMQHRILVIARRRVILLALQDDARLSNKSRKIQKVLTSQKLTEECLKDFLDCLQSLWEECRPAGTILSESLVDEAHHDYNNLSAWHRRVVEKWNEVETVTHPVYHWQILILIGAALIVAGYVGCFSIVQGSQSSSAPIIWLGAEILLSAFRMFLWALNPPWDENTGTILNLITNARPPLPTCPNYAMDLEKHGVLSLESEANFLDQLRTHIGFISHLDVRPINHGLSFFYTLTRRSPSSTLLDFYITVVDNDGPNAIILQRSNAQLPYLRKGHFSSSQPHEVMIEGSMTGTDNYLTNNQKFMGKLVKHYRSVQAALNSRSGHCWRISMDWRICNLNADFPDIGEVPSTKDTRRKLRARESESLGRATSRPVVESTEMQAAPESEAEFRYLAFGNIEHESRQRYVDQRVEWIKQYVQYVIVRANEDLDVFVSEEAVGSTGIEVFLEELKMLEIGLIKEILFLEQVLCKEYYGRLRTLLHRRVHPGRTAHAREIPTTKVVARLTKEKEQSLLRMSAGIQQLKKGALSVLQTDENEEEAMKKEVSIAWDELIHEASRLVHSTAEDIKRPHEMDIAEENKRSLMPSNEDSVAWREWYQSRVHGMEERLSREILDRWSRMSRYSNPHTWASISANEGLAYMALAEDLKFYVLNKQTMDLDPALSMLSGRGRLECLFFDLANLHTLPQQRDLDKVFRDQKQLTSIGVHYDQSHPPSKATTYRLLLIIRDNPNILSLWGMDGILYDHHHSNVQGLLKQRRVVRGQHIVDNPFVTYHRGHCIIDKTSLSRPCIVGGEDSPILSRITFWGPSKISSVDMLEDVVLQVTLCRVVAPLKATICMKISGLDTLTEHIIENDQWKVYRFKIKSYHPEEQNVLTVKVIGGIANMELRLKQNRVDNHMVEKTTEIYDRLHLEDGPSTVVYLNPELGSSSSLSSSSGSGI
ncbi:hypothetical protein CVT26_014747 [Gymnopilus dilepis]|uniref:Uncharacterized protein n=1 Tax=Gymnopilus dilepis TaxID=231916 RepID=A0A409WR13_9AGAR|nr:hypothetical protein CVT26_014747 [Gymnopilus dilepis]